MPKAKKIRAAALDNKVVRHDPLGQVIVEDSDRHKYARQKSKRTPHNDGGNDEVKEGLLDSKASRRILKIGKEQQLEIQAEEVLQRRQQRKLKTTDYRLDSDEEDDDDNEELLDDQDDGDEYDLRIQKDDQGYVDIAEMPGLSPEDEALVASMMGASADNAEPRHTLADLILEKIQEKEAEKRGEMAPSAEDPMGHLPPKVVEVYTDIGRILGRYTSGKLPKAFKVIPSLSNWEEVLYLTRPDMWTAPAMYQATRIFASNLNPKMAQRFYNLVLLDAVRADIVHNKKLNYHYYMALKKSVYKPAAFFKGILLPLCKSADCTLREAAIVASVLQRVSIPVHHSAVAIHKLATSQQAGAHYSGATSIFLKTLLNKKYSLPAPVVAGLVQYFAGFLDNKSELPVLWHQSLLVFVQRYKHELQNPKTKEMLRRVLKRNFHPKITPETRRELFGSAAYQQERKDAKGSTLGATASMASSSGMVIQEHDDDDEGDMLI